MHWHGCLCIFYSKNSPLNLYFNLGTYYINLFSFFLNLFFKLRLKGLDLFKFAPKSRLLFFSTSLASNCYTCLCLPPRRGRKNSKKQQFKSICCFYSALRIDYLFKIARGLGAASPRKKSFRPPCIL